MSRSPVQLSRTNGGHDGDSRVPRRRGLPGGDRPHNRRVESLPGRRRSAPRRVRRTCSSSSSTTSASVSSAATAARSTTPNFDAIAAERPALQQHAHHGALLAEPLLHRHRPQPPHQRHGRASPSSPPATRATTASSRSRTACSPRCSWSTATTPTWSASGTSRRATRRPRPGPYTRWPLARGFERFYGFLGGDTSQWYPELVYDNHQVEPPARPEEGYHLTPDLVDKSIEFIADAKQIDPDKPFYLLLLLRRHARAAPRAEGVGRQVRRPVRRRLGRLPREDLRAPEGARHRTGGHRALAPRPRRPRLGRAARRGAQALQPHDGGVRRLPQPHRPPPRAAARLPARPGPARQHHRHGDLGQRRQRRGRTDGDYQRGAVLQQRPGTARGQPQGHRRDRRPQALQPLPVGLDLRRQHAVPALEAGDLPRRRLRPVHRLLAGGHQGQGRDQRPVRAHHRHGADRPRPARP